MYTSIEALLVSSVVSRQCKTNIVMTIFVCKTEAGPADFSNYEILGTSIMGMLP